MADTTYTIVKAKRRLPVALTRAVTDAGLDYADACLSIALLGQRQETTAAELARALNSRDFANSEITRHIRACVKHAVK